MRIGIDIDDTLTDIKDDLDKAAYEYAKELGKEIIVVDNTLNNTTKVGNENLLKYSFSNDELKYFNRDLQEIIWEAAIPRDGVVEVIKKLKEDGHEIYIITARHELYHDDPYTLSKQWLDKHNIVYDKLVVNASNKGKVCLEENIDIHIDDQLRHCLSVYNNGIPVIRMSEEEHKDVVSFDNWYDIYDYISNEKIVKIIPYNNSYSNQVSDFINESMNVFIDRPYKIREDIANIDDYYIETGGNFRLAIDVRNNTVVGTIALENRDEVGILKRFYVNKDYQNLNIGKRLYNVFENYTVSNTNIKVLYLACGKVLDKAHRFYEKNGWTMIDELPIEMHIADDDDIFEKIINNN